ncbi:beta-defensin 125 [Suricata suricatta]|uniref:Beta-defensin n=1 Tax=Suricata suricatta TaxID=37032 RepID=A0A673UQX7_SURSU|nr:beta-defensin 125 [Suricata suricatta]
MKTYLMIIAILLTLDLKTSAGWGVKRCWENNIGHCRKRCFHVERYKLLCMNKLTCCIPIKDDHGFTKMPPRPGPFEEITVDVNDRDLFSNSPVTWFNDEVTMSPSGGLTEVSSRVSTYSPETTDSTTN